MKYFLSFLFVITTGELIAYQGYLGFYVTYFLAVLESVFYCYIFYNLIDSISVKRVMICFTGVVVIGFIVGFLFFDTSRRYMHFFMKVRIIAGLLTTFYSLFYLYARFRAEEGQRMIKDSGFWIALGVIMYSAGISCIFSLYSIIVEQRLRLFGEPLYRLVPRFLCVILYSCLAISIILHAKNKSKASYRTT
jgi:hypothetical protein